MTLSRKIDAAVQTEDSRSAWVNHSIEDFTCPVTHSLFFDPVIACNTTATCGHSFEKKESAGKLESCPCCRAEITLFSPALHTKNTLDDVLSAHPELWQDVYFNLDHFTEVLTQENGLKTPNFIRFIRLLEHAPNHLNNKAIEGAQRGKSAIEILASTPAGRDLLRKKLSINTSSGKFLFGRAEISVESLQIQVNDKSIGEWLLSIATQLTANFQRMLRSQGLFAANSAAAPMDQRPSHPAVNEILQNVVRGNKEAVRIALEKLRTGSSDLLRTVLIATATQPITDYSNRAIVDQTLLQAAACAGDVAINPDEREMCEMIAFYLPADEVTAQFTELFPHGVEAHETDQQRNTFSFDAILAAIRAATPPDLDVALNKIDAEFTQSDSARAKPDHELSLIEALNRFREQFPQHSHSEKIFNPQHLLRALEVYNTLCGQCERDGSDRDYKKRDLFWRQIIGYTQRFMPACYAQAFAQGLYYLVKVDQDASWRPEPFSRALKLKHDNFSYFPLPVNPRSGLGFDFAISPWLASSPRPAPDRGGFPSQIFSKTFVEQKQQAFRTLCREFERSRPTMRSSVMR